MSAPNTAQTQPSQEAPTGPDGKKTNSLKTVPPPSGQDSPSMVQSSASRTDSLTTTAPLDLSKEFDIHLTELEPLSKDNKGQAAISSRLIAYEIVRKRAIENGVALQSLHLSEFGSG